MCVSVGIHFNRFLGKGSESSATHKVNKRKGGKKEKMDGPMAIVCGILVFLVGLNIGLFL